MEHFGAAFELHLTEETRTHLQEEAATRGGGNCLLLLPHTGYAYVRESYIRYDTIRCRDCTRKLTDSCQFSLAHIN